MQSSKIEFDAIGTSWEIDFYEIVDQKDDVFSLVSKLADDFDKTYSRFRDDSLISQMALRKGEYTLPQNGKIIFDLFFDLYNKTNSLLTPFIGDVLDNAGYDKDYSFKERIIQKPKKWDEYIDYEFPKITVKKPTIIDLGACGKGYLVDLIAKLLMDNNVKNFCINAGGDIYCNNHQMVIGLENPLNFEQVIGTVDINNKAIASSSGNRRKWGKYHHIINPQTLKSPSQILSTWVITETTILADAIATALFLCKPEQLLQHYNFEYLVLYPDFTIKKSLHFNADLFYDK